MIRRPNYLNIPWEMHWRAEPHGQHDWLWWWIIVVTLLVVFFAGVGILGGA